jgi:membrane fusion protein (multidrug efflux system)
VDFTVTQQVAAGLREGGVVEVIGTGSASALAATIVAIDSRVDVTTRNAMVRARIEGAENTPAPGASVRVRVPVGPSRRAVAIPVSALRKGPAGDHVFVIAEGRDGKPRAQLRPVQSGTMLGDEVLIYSGLSPGEQVAASGSFKLRDSALVATVSDPAAQASVAGY